MTQTHRMVALAAAVMTSACSGSDGGPNPSRLYLAPLDSELTVQLVEKEPPPF